VVVVSGCKRGERRGLKAIAYGFAYLHGKDDLKNFELETPMYDVLYAFCQQQVQSSEEW